MITRRYVLAINDTVDRDQFLQELEQNSESVRTYPTLTEYFAVSWYPQQYEHFKDDPRIAIIERDRAAVIASPVRKVIDRYNSNWGLARIDQINQPVFQQNKGTFWRTRLGENVDIYVMDTGIRTTHQEFAGNVTRLIDTIRRKYKLFGNDLTFTTQITTNTNRLFYSIVQADLTNNSNIQVRFNNETSVIISNASNGKKLFGKKIATAKDIATRINSANIPNLSASAPSSNATITLINSRGKPIQLSTIRSDKNKVSFEGNDSISGLPNYYEEPIVMSSGLLSINGVSFTIPTGSTLSDVANIFNSVSISTNVFAIADYEHGYPRLNLESENPITIDSGSDSALLAVLGHSVGTFNDINPLWHTDETGHGTHVAGIAGSMEYGVARGANLISVKTFGPNGTGLTSDIIAGIDAILNHHTTKTSGNPSVANFSWTYAGVEPFVEGAIRNKLYQQGVVVVTAAGNSDDDASKYTPARMSEILTVGSINIGDEISGFSNISTIGQFVESGQIVVDGAPQDPIPQTNTGAAVDIFAPGDGIKSTWNNDDRSIKTLNGTSMASPFAAGVAAFRLQGQPKPTTAAEVDAVNQFIIDVSTKGKIQDLPAGTNDRILYSFYVPSTLTWLDPTDDYTVIGEFDEQTQVNIQLRAESLTVYDEQQTVTYTVVGGTLPTGLTLDSGTGEITGTAPLVTADTDFTFTVRAEGGENTEDRTVTVTVLNVNLPPVWDTAPNLGTFLEQDTVNITLQATDPEAETVTYSILNGDISAYNLSLNSSTGVISGTLPDLDDNETLGPIEFTVRASDPKGVPTGIADRTFSFNIVGSNPPPVWVTPIGKLQPGGADPVEGTLFNFTVEGTDPESEPLTYVLIDGAGLVGEPGDPEPLTLDPTTGNINGLLPTTAAGTYTITIALDDGVNPLVERDFDIDVINTTGNIAPYWITPSGNIGNFNEGENVLIILEGQDPEGLPISFAFGTPPATTGFEQTGLPPSLSLNSTGVISGTIDSNLVTSPLTQQTWRFSVDITDSTLTGVPKTVNREFNITVFDVAANTVPFWVTPAGSLGSVIEGDPVNLGVKAIDPDDDFIIYKLISGKLPPGVQLNEFTGEIYGKPAPVTSDTTYTFVIIATDELVETTWNKDNTTFDSNETLFDLEEASSAIPRTFSITVTDYWTADIWKIEIDLTGHDRIKTAYEWRTQVDEFKLYRKLDPNFGFLSHTAISLVDGINLFPPGFDPSGLLVDIETTFDSDTTTFSVAGDQTTFDTSEASSAADVLINELSTHHSPHKVLLGELNYAVARDTTGAIIYEVIYREILDPHRKADFLVPYPQANSAVQLLSGDGITTTFSLIHTGQTRRTIAVYEDQVQVPFEELNVSGTTLTFNTPPAAGSEIRVYYLTINAPTTPQASAVEYLTPASINNWRRDLIDKFGFADPELLPLWQRSEQVLGDPTSIPGYIPVIPLAYAQPGEAKHIIDGITSDPVAWCTFKIDRYHIQNEVDDIQDRINFDVIDNQTTWNADTTTYDNDTTLFDIATETTFDGDTTRFDVEEIGRVDKYIKFPPGDLLGVS